MGKCGRVVSLNLVGDDYKNKQSVMRYQMPRLKINWKRLYNDIQTVSVISKLDLAFGKSPECFSLVHSGFSNGPGKVGFKRSV
jgi:hypothetical protein